jgi:ribosomal protein S18 acetylase RimI-like enzyme
MSITHSIATDADWDRIVSVERTQLQNRLYACAKDVEEAKKYLKHSTVYLLYADGKLAGDVSFETEGDEADINGLIVLPQFQQKGIGKYGFDLVLDTLKKKKIKKAKLVTHPENSRALVLYITRGFKIKGWLDNPFGDGEPRLQLEKIL